MKDGFYEKGDRVVVKEGSLDGQFATVAEDQNIKGSLVAIQLDNDERDVKVMVSEEKLVPVGWIEDKKEDGVNHPSHYASGEIECIDAMIAAYGKQEVAIFCKLNVFKYLWRLGKKDDVLKECGKIKWYNDKQIELINQIRKEQ